MTNSQKGRVASVVVNWNGAEETLTCIESLRQAGAQPESIYIVDNGSSDDSVQRLRDGCSQAVLLTSNLNLGFAGGTNLGIRQAMHGGHEWILIANNDTRVASDFYQTLLHATETHTDYDIFTPIILYHDRPSAIWSMGDRRVMGTFITRSILQNCQVPPTLPPLVDVDFAAACCLLIHRTVFDQIGLFSESYFMYGEDVEFCWRAKSAGFRIGTVTDAKMWHKVAWSSRGMNPTRQYWRILNQIQFYRTAASGVHRWILFVFTAIRSAYLAGAAYMAGECGMARKTLQAWANGWRQKSFDVHRRE